MRMLSGEAPACVLSRMGARRPGDPLLLNWCARRWTSPRGMPIYCWRLSSSLGASSAARALAVVGSGSSCSRMTVVWSEDSTKVKRGGDGGAMVDDGCLFSLLLLLFLRKPLKNPLFLLFLLSVVPPLALFFGVDESSSVGVNCCCRLLLLLRQDAAQHRGIVVVFLVQHALNFPLAFRRQGGRGGCVRALVAGLLLAWLRNEDAGLCFMRR